MPERMDSSAVSSESETDSGSRSKGSHPSATDLGKRVLFRSQNDKKEKYGTLRYWGTPEFAPGSWCGIELDEPTGKNNGSVHGIRYFSCPVNYGVFIPVGRVELDSAGLSRAKPQTVTVERIKKSSLSSNKGVFTYHTLPRASSIPALNKISSSPRSATLSPSIRLEVPAKKHVADKKHSAPSIGLSTLLSKHNKKSNGPTVKKSQYLSTSTGLKKYTSESNIRGRLTESTNIPDHQTKRSTRKLLSSCSDTQSKFESNSLRSFNSCNDLSHQTKKSPTHSTVLFPRTSTPYDSEDSQSRYSSTSDLSRRNSTSDSDPTPQSSSASPDIELTLLESADNAFLLSPLNDTVIKIPSPEHKVPLPLGLSTPTTNFIETSRCNGGRGGECRMPSPEQTPVKRYHNRQRVRTLEHPLINGHSAHRLPSEYCDTTEEEEEQDNIFISSHGQSQEVVFANGYGNHGDRGESKSDRLLLRDMQVQLEQSLKNQESLEGHVKELEGSLKNVHCQFETILKKAQDDFQKQIEDFHSLYKKEIEQLSRAHDQELLALHKSHQHSIEELRKEFYSNRTESHN